MTMRTETPISLRKAKRSALLLAFPSTEAFREFKNDDMAISEQAIPAFIRFAHEAELIHKASEDAFIAFIENNSAASPKETLVKSLTFEEVIDAVKGKMSVNGLVAQANIYTQRLSMPTLHASMFTNLKKNFKSDSPKKRAALRMLAFWIGLNRPNFPVDYEMLVNLPGNQDDQAVAVTNKTGVRIDITFKGQEGIVSFEMVDWLKNEIPKCIEDLKLYYIVGTTPKFHSATTATLEIPNHTGQTRDPWLYGQALRGCFAIAHQISMRWSLSDTGIDKQSSILVAIAAGNFSELSAAMPYLLERDLPGNPSIRVNGFAHFITRITDIKVLFHKTPIVSTLTPNSTLQIWSVKNFWFLYYDIIPNLLDEGMLPVHEDHYKQFKDELYFSAGTFSSETMNKTLTAIRRAPQNHQLIIEVAKVLMARRMFAEANTVLTIILASNPNHVIARVFRIQLIINMGMGNPDYRIFNAFFKQAVAESRLILETGELDDEVWSEIGLMYASKAYYILKLMRKKGPPEKDECKALNLEEILSNIDEAEKCFQKGITHAPNGHRSYFWIIQLRCLKILLMKDRRLLTSKAPILDHDNIYSEVSFQHLAFLGWYNPSISMDQQNFDSSEILSLIGHFRKAADNTKTAVHFRTFRPSIIYSVAVVLWDICPVLTTGIATQVLEWLEEARHEAKELTRNCLGIYSIVSWHSQIQSPGHFIRCIDRTMDTIWKILKEDIQKDENHIIDKKKVRGLKLMTMHIDEAIESMPLLAQGGG